MFVARKAKAKAKAKAKRKTTLRGFAAAPRSHAASHFRNQNSNLALLSRGYLYCEPHSANHPVRLRLWRKRTPLHGGEITAASQSVAGRASPSPTARVKIWGGQIPCPLYFTPLSNERLKV